MSDVNFTAPQGGFRNMERQYVEQPKMGKNIWLKKDHKIKWAPLKGVIRAYEYNNAITVPLISQRKAPKQVRIPFVNESHLVGY